jgi:aspartate dehydrogenase
LLGCGTIGSELANAIDSGKIPDASLASIYDVSSARSDSLASRLTKRAHIAERFDEFINSDFDLMIEAASQAAVKDSVEPAFTSGKDIMIMSVGALVDPLFLERIVRMASTNNHMIYLPSGAIGGLDVIRAVRHLLKTISLTTIKNPRALAGAPFIESSSIDLTSIRERTVIFEGDAFAAVRGFPANVNVAAIISLAGIGPEKTSVKIIADPLASTNTHIIEAEGQFGELRIEVRNTPSPNNPKTSYLAILSAIECLRSICGGRISIGS